jgi:hypothetical protein
MIHLFLRWALVYIVFSPGYTIGVYRKFRFTSRTVSCGSWIGRANNFAPDPLLPRQKPAVLLQGSQVLIFARNKIPGKKYALSRVRRQISIHKFKEDLARYLHIIALVRGETGARRVRWPVIPIPLLFHLPIQDLFCSQLRHLRVSFRERYEEMQPAG